MKLEIDGRQIVEPIINIINDLKDESPSYVFKSIRDKGEYISCTCPFHADGNERHPSFSVYASYDSEIVPGTFHCFTCGAKGQLYQLVSYILQISEDEAKEWLIDKYANVYIEEIVDLPVFDLHNNIDANTLPEETLNKYAYYHPYIAQRKINKNIVKKFKIGYDPENKCVVFPLRDIHGKLIGVSKRSVESKKFFIPSGIDKPVYLLDEIIKNNFPFVIITEAQIDALTAWSYGVPAVATLGTGCDSQYELIKKYNINWVTMFDNDEAGRKATDRFNRKMRGTNSFITNIKIPDGKKDINDLSKEEFDSLLNNAGLTYRLTEVQYESE